MNDWPVDPKLDRSLRSLVDAELVAARADASALSLRPESRRTRSAPAWVGLGGLAVVTIVAALVLRGTGPGYSAGGGPGESATPEASGAVTNPSPSVAVHASPTEGSPTPAASEPPSGSFISTGKMTTSDNGEATLLLDGRVLIVGNGATSPELYDPSTGTFTSTGKAAIGGNFGSSTRLVDGRVLFAGGNDNTTTFRSAQLYDPATGSFIPTGSLITDRMGHTATLLNDGRVLIAGGSTFNMALALAYHPGMGGSTRVPVGMTGPAMLASAELYDPKAGTFTPTGSMTTGRDYASATLLADGRVLIAGGGNEGSAAVRSAELYDPKTGKFSLTGSMLGIRYAFTSLLLHDGRVLIVGGNDGNGPVYSLEVYDPNTGAFSAAGSLGQQGFPTAVALADGRVLIVGGFDVSAGKVAGYLASCQLFDPATDSVTPTGSMSSPRLVASATLLTNGRVLVAGGVDGGEQGSVDTAELYQP